VDLAKIRKKARREGPKETPERSPSAGAPAEAAPEPETVPAPATSPAVPGTPPPAKRKKAAAPEPSPPVPEVPAEAQEEFVYTPMTQPEAPAASRNEAAPAGKGERLLIFTLDREMYAIPIHDIALIIQDASITPIPNAPDFLLGILSLRGKVVSILDAARRLELARRESSAEGKIIVLDMGADQFGLRVDGIDQLVEVDLSSLEPPPEGFTPLPQDFVEGVFHHKGRAVGYLNLPMFLSFQV
jgi:purine-binding chemotaxis protein CheW